jgi:hypothetical protein
VTYPNGNFPGGDWGHPGCAASPCTDCACLCVNIEGNCADSATDGCLVLDGGFLFIYHDQV